MKSRPLSAAIAAYALLIGAACVHAAPIAITNAGFENFALVDEDYSNDLIPGWTGTLGGVDYLFGIYNPPASVFPAQAPEGQNIAFIQRGAIFQRLSEALTLGKYTLSVQVGDSLIDPLSPFTVELRAGGAVLAQSTSPVPANGTFGLVTVNYEALEGHPSLGQQLEIRLVDDGFDYVTEPYFDDVRLDFQARAPDFDGNGIVDGGDLARWRNGFGTGSTHMQGDANGYGGVDGTDLLIWQRQLGSVANPLVSGTVPEPASVALLALGMPLLISRNSLGEAERRNL
jgi:hypothetical protein